MESLELAEEGALSLPNTFRNLRTSYLRYCLLSGCLSVIFLTCSSFAAPGCIDRTPRQTTTGFECYYRWKWEQHLCDSYCCNGTTLGVEEGDWCVDYCFEDGNCELTRCAPAQSQGEYVALQMLRWSGAVAFYLVWMLFFLLGRMLCRTTTALEKKTACRTACLFAVFTVFLYGLYSIYLFTDCHHEFRGIADLFLAAGLLASFLCVRYLVGVASSQSGVESYDMLLAMISDSYTRGDGRTLVLEVGQERLRDFWQENLSGQTDTAFTVSKRYRYCITIVLLSLCIGACGILFTARQRFFLCWMGFFGSVLPMLYFYALTLAPVQNWTMRRKAAKALANLPSRDKVVLFANGRSPENAAERQSAEFMSIAYFSGQDPVFFRTEAGADETLVWNWTVRTAITEMNGHWYLSFTTTARRSTASLLQSSDVQVEVPRHFPLEASDVRLAREWLQQHEIFGLQ